MEINNVCVLGGSGFIGRHVCEQLAARGYEVVVPARNRERAKALILLPTVDVVQANVHDPDQLDGLLRATDAVINLIGVLHDGRGAGGFLQAHVRLAEKVVAACRRRGVKRLLHMSALNADPQGPSAYLRSKGEAEAIVRSAEPAATIFRPSVVFGREDRFLNLFAQLQRRLPVVLLGSPRARFQPIFVEDVAAVIVRSLEEPAAPGRRYDLCGPKVYTLRELVQYAGAVSGHPRPVIGLGPRLSFVQSAVMEVLPGKLLTRDNYRSMSLDAVCAQALPFGVRPTPLEAVAPTWLSPEPPRVRFRRLHGSAGR